MMTPPSPRAPTAPNRSPKANNTPQNCPFLAPGDRHAIPVGLYKYGQDPTLKTTTYTTNFTVGLGIGLWHFDLSGDRVNGAGPFREKYIHLVQHLYRRSPKGTMCTDTPYVSVIAGDSFLPLYRRTLVKSRVINDTRGVLLPLNYHRHWGTIWESVKDDIPFEAKSDLLVWRGTTTGYPDHPGEVAGRCHA